MKKVIVFTLSLLLIFSSVSFAARSSSGFKSSPRPSSSMQSVSPARQADTASPGTNYKSSAPANSYSDKAPSQVKPGAQQSMTQNQPSTGGFWRNAGFFGGGMLMGGLLSHMLGFGQMGAMASIFGMLFNLLLLAAVIMGVRYLWNKMRNRDNKRDV